MISSLWVLGAALLVCLGIDTDEELADPSSTQETMAVSDQAKMPEQKPT